MSVKGEVLYHAVNKSEEQTWDGFSWPAFLFGPIWLLVKGLWGQALIYILIIVVTLGWGALIVWFVYGFMGNGLHKASLLKNGYLTKDQVDKSSAIPPTSSVSGPAAVDPVQRLKELADLKDRGVLSESEFAQQKARILGIGNG